METFTGHRWIPIKKASDAELWCFLRSAPWINGWVNNGEAGDLRRHRSQYDVICNGIISNYLSMACNMKIPWIWYDTAGYSNITASFTLSLSYYRQTSNISDAKCPNLNVSRLVLQLSLPNPLKPGVNLKMKIRVPTHSGKLREMAFPWKIREISGNLPSSSGNFRKQQNLREISGKFGYGRFKCCFWEMLKFFISFAFSFQTSIMYGSICLCSVYKEP